MKLSTHLIKAALLAPTVLAYLPACSSTSPTPCSCPSGYSYEESVTFAVIGAAATDVRALISDFFNTAWEGGLPFATHGPDNKPGSTRSASGGTYNFTEELTEFESHPSGSFIEKFERITPFTTAKGSSSADWVTLQSKSIFQYETAITWSVYACSIGHPANYAAFHEASLANATNVLQAAGKVSGSNVKPFSIQAF